MITISSFNRYFGKNPLETLNNIKNDSIQNGNPELTKKEREQLGNSLINVYKHYEKLSNKIDLVEGSIEDKLRKNELSKKETENLLKWINENTISPSWLSINGVSYDEAYIKVFHTSKNIDEFKTKFLELQKEYAVNFNKIEIENKKQETLKEYKKKPFEPIKSESKNKETYKDNDTRNELVKKLLKSKFDMSQELELLFGIKFSGDDAGKINQFLFQNTTPKSIDIRA